MYIYILKQERTVVCSWAAYFDKLLVWCGQMPGAHQNRSVTPPSQMDRGEEIWRKARGSRQGQGEITHQLPSCAKQTELGKKREF